MNKELIELNKQVEFKTLKEIEEYQYKEYITTLIYRGSEPLRKEDLPKNENGFLKVIYLIDINQSNINLSIIPEGVEELHFPFENESITINLKNGELPKSIKSIYNFNINESNDYLIDSTTIPNQITTLSFRCYSNFNDRINSERFKLPTTITSLTFGDDWKNGGFSFEKGDFHEGLKNLNIIGYDKPLTDCILPQSLESLSISHPNNYTLPLLNDKETFLPTNLKTLSISSQFNKGLTIPTNSIPQSITSLKLMSTDIEIDNLFYKNSTIKNLEIKISLKKQKQQISKEMLPSNLQSLTVSTESNIIEKNALPKSLEYLNYSIQDQQLTDTYQLLNNGFLNEGLKKLLIDLPNLEINNHSNVYFNDIFPKSLKELTLSNKFNINLNLLNKNGSNVFNEGLEKLKFGYYYNGEIELGLLPSTLKELEFGSSFNSPLKGGSLPNGLKVLRFEEYGNFNQPFELNSLPLTLEQLYLPKGYNQSLTLPFILPLSLKVIQIPKKLKINNLINDSSIPSSVLIIKFN
ncbi:hypothetical protein RB653_006449 [Dictyostelium firmibasis]|uniref:FNIP repeat-containing protein n=1 Tax=Dictyostelium firmibasis TaxID=79012 RepID=A0AAN7U9C3_9MYCE